MKPGEDPRKDQSNDGPDYPDNAPNKPFAAPGSKEADKAVEDSGSKGSTETHDPGREDKK